VVVVVVVITFAVLVWSSRPFRLFRRQSRCHCRRCRRRCRCRYRRYWNGNYNM